MAYFFDGLDDRIHTVNSQTFSDILSVSLRMWPETLGEGNNGFLYAHGTGTSPRTLLSILQATSPAGPAVEFFVNRATDGRWQTMGGSIVLQSWAHVGLTYDGTVATNVPTIYLNGDQVGIQQIGAAPSGAMGVADPTYLQFGSDSGMTRVFRNLLYELAIWNRILDPREMKRVFLQGPTSVSRSMHIHWRGTKFATPGLGTAFDLSGTGTVGTVVGASFNENNPPIAIRDC